MSRWIGVSLSLLIALPLCAQEPRPAEELTNRARTAIQDPSLSSPLTAALSQLTLISSGDDTSLRAEAGLELSNWLLGLRIETAIEAGQNKADLVNLEGLTGKSKATFTATRLFFGGFDPTAIIDVCHDYNNALGRLDAVPPGPNGCADVLARRVADWDQRGGALSQDEQERAARDRDLLRRSDAAVLKAVEAICVEYDVDHAIAPADCMSLEAAKAALPEEWDKKLDQKITEMGAPLCTLACAATFRDRAAAWAARENSRARFTETEKAQAQRDRDWLDRVEKAEQEAFTAICTEYNKTGSDPILPEDCRDATMLRNALPDAFDAKLDAKVHELVAKVCQDFNATRPASWGWLNTTDTSSCTLSALREKGDDWEAKAVRATHFSPTIFSLSAALDRQDYEYIVIGPQDPQTPPKEKLDDPTKQSEFGFAVTASYGKLFFAGRSFLYGGGGVSLTRAFEGGPTKQICRPSTVAGMTLCEDVVTTAPSEKSRQTVHAEARWFPSRRVGLIPRLAYEFDEKVATAQLTTFFLTHETKGLNGGIDLAYRDDDIGFVARLFVGTSFSLLP